MLAEEMIPNTLVNFFYIKWPAFKELPKCNPMSGNAQNQEFLRGTDSNEYIYSAH